MVKVRSGTPTKHVYKCNMQTAADISRVDEAMDAMLMDLVKYGEIASGGKGAFGLPVKAQKPKKDNKKAEKEFVTSPSDDLTTKTT